MANGVVDHANPYTNQVFQDAVTRNDIAVVKLLLKYGIQPKRNERNMQGLTALQQSVLDGNSRLAILLLEAGADIEAKTSNGWTCLHFASALGDLDMIYTLINHCCDLIALTKNEELPIDLAATRDIKIKLAHEMSRIGYNELAQWYMRKLAAREGVCYVLSADTLLDLACDDKYDRSYSTAYSYYIRRDDIIDTTEVVRNQQHISQTGSLKRKQEINKPSSMWVEFPTEKSINFPSSYTSNDGEKSLTLELNKTGRRSTLSMGSPPQRKPTSEFSDYLKMTPDEDDNLLRFGSLKRNGSLRQSSQSMQRKMSTIELHIDYSNISEEADEFDETNEVFDEELERRNNLSDKSPIQMIDTLKLDENHYRHDDSHYRHDETDSKSKNVRFNPEDNANEFCNCPNCKKMGYAFSPDIQADSRKPVAENSYLLSPSNHAVFEMQQHYEMLYAANYINPQFYVPITTTNDPKYYSQDKPRKRKKKLFSGIKSMFKDGGKMSRSNADNIYDDPSVLYSFPIREPSTSIKQRSVRKSNSFNEKVESRDVDIFSHSQVMIPAKKYSEGSHSDGESSYHSSTNTITPQDHEEEKESDTKTEYNSRNSTKADGNIFEGLYPTYVNHEETTAARTEQYVSDTFTSHYVTDSYGTNNPHYDEDKHEV